MSASGTAAVMWLLTRPGSNGRATVAAVQVAASALTTLLSFGVVSVARAFWGASPIDPTYRVLAVALMLLLVFPLVTLGSTAARLSARSREERLAALRLLGASVSRVRWIAVAGATSVSAIGVAVGTGLGLLLPLALGSMHVGGERVSRADLALPWWLSLGIPVALIGVAALSGILGLRSVIIAPLGVRARANAPRLSWLRVLLAVGAVAGAVLLTQAVSPGWGVAAAVGALGLSVLAVMGALSALGPFMLARLTARMATQTGDPAKLIALRSIADAPREAWLSVSVLALASFITLPVGSLLGYLDAIQRSESGALITPAQLSVMRDARTLLIALVAVACAVAACQLAITQVSSVIERRELFLALHYGGMPLSTMQRSRRRSAMLPATVAVSIAVIAAVFLAAPVIFAGTVTSPLFTLSVAVVLAAGLALVSVGVAATSPALRHELARASGGSA